jgi:pimeloyl-ACP methyl ester carboxylesterase
MIMPISILFLPGTGLPDQFYDPLLASLNQHGHVHHWRYRHRESMVEACRRLGGGAEMFSALRQEVCFGASGREPSLLDLQADGGISQWYEDLAVGETAEELWHRTVVVGHSQGAGHALLLSQQRRLAGAVMIAGPADASADQLAPWTQQPFQTPSSRRLLLVHVQDAGCRTVLGHAETCGLRIRKWQEAMPQEPGGLALLDTEVVPALSAHGCLAGGQTWSVESPRQASYCALLSWHFQQWQRS